MKTTVDESNETTILERVIAPSGPSLAPEVATEILKWDFSETDRLRMAELAAKAREDRLTAEERAEAEEFEQVSSFLGIVKSKARRSLKAASEQTT